MAADACGRRRGGARRPGPGQVDLSCAVLSAATPHAAHPNRPADTHDILTLGMWTSHPAPPPPRTSEAPRPPGRGGPKRATPTPLGPIWPSPPREEGRLRTLADTDGAERSVLDPARSTCRVRYFRRRPPRRTPEPPGRHTRHTDPRDADLAPRPTSSQNLGGTPPPGSVDLLGPPISGRWGTRVFGAPRLPIRRYSDAPPTAGRAEKSHAYAARPRLALPSSGGGVAADACGRRRGGARRPGPGQVDLSCAVLSAATPHAAHPNRPADTHDILTLGMWTSHPAPPPPRTSEAPRPPGRGGPKRATPTPLGPVWPSPPREEGWLRTLADADGAERDVLGRPVVLSCAVLSAAAPQRRTPEPPGRHTRHTDPRDADLAPRPTSSQNLGGTPPPRAGRAEKAAPTPLGPIWPSPPREEGWLRTLADADGAERDLNVLTLALSPQASE